MSIPDNDINSLIESLPKEMEVQKNLSQPEVETQIQPTTPADNGTPDGILWNEFLDFLKDSDEEDEEMGSKSYDIDDDIIFTLQQCDFGKPKVYVINSILRAFIMANVPNLKKILKPKRISLIDKYYND